jgi:hypothetical protein
MGLVQKMSLIFEPCPVFWSLYSFLLKHKHAIKRSSSSQNDHARDEGEKKSLRAFLETRAAADADANSARIFLYLPRFLFCRVLLNRVRAKAFWGKVTSREILKVFESGNCLSRTQRERERERVR